MSLRQAQGKLPPARLRLGSHSAEVCDSDQGQDGRDACRSTPLTNYFCVGAWFCGAVGGAVGVGVVCDFVCAGFTPENTDDGPVRRAA